MRIVRFKEFNLVNGLRVAARGATAGRLIPMMTERLHWWPRPSPASCRTGISSGNDTVDAADGNPFGDRWHFERTWCGTRTDAGRA